MGGATAVHPVGPTGHRTTVIRTYYDVTRPDGTVATFTNPSAAERYNGQIKGTLTTRSVETPT